MTNIIFLILCCLSQLCIICSVSNYIIPTYIALQSYDTQFVPINQVELISTLYNVNSLTFCGALCNLNYRCRTFDYNLDKQCRLFESFISTGIVQNFLRSVVGALINYPTTSLSLFANYNQTCTDNCDSNHYLDCNILTQRCQCSFNTFWNGTFCRNQLYPPSTCKQWNWCRQDLRLTCNFNTSKCQCATIGIYQYYWNGTECVLGDYLTHQTQLHYERNWPTAYNWTQFIHKYTAFNTIATLVFGIRNDATWNWLDDVAVYDTLNATVNLIQNWDFEQGDASWNYSNPFQATFPGMMEAEPPSSDPNSQPHSGTWVFSDGSTNAQDFLSQTFLTTPGHNYTVSYYFLYRYGTISEINVTMWP